MHGILDISAKRARLCRRQVRSEKARANRRLGGWNCFAARPMVYETTFMFLITVGYNMGDYTCFMCQWQDNERDNFVLVLRGTDVVNGEPTYVCVACCDEFYGAGQYVDL